MRVAARDAPSRVDEARPYYPPNEDDETEGRQRAMALPGSLPRGGEGRGRAEARRGTKRFDAAARGQRDKHGWRRAGRWLDSPP
ncbi:hypothetical protein CFB52_022830 [Burkholderia sp. AU18528]|nr:hypothetical protein CFB35_23140 [Burkholderia sp. AU16482]PHP87281.1 hypothetical protein CFB52_022830 [Burkholderia sp. AU18528]RQV84799.1 hypothetical protein DF160_08080 [Burkholderia anthina]RQX81582.1 hypothetical protein DF034_18160 [Burkholderia anthina]WJN74313.1 hypothetical protein OH687_28795 [Burkholderia anthina]